MSRSLKNVVKTNCVVIVLTVSAILSSVIPFESHSNSETHSANQSLEEDRSVRDDFHEYDRFGTRGDSDFMQLLKGSNLAFRDIEWKPDGGYALVVTDFHLLKYDGLRLLYIQTHEGHPLRAVSWHPSGSYALIVGLGIVLKYDGTDVTIVMEDSYYGLRGIGWRPDGSYAFIVGRGEDEALDSYKVVLKYQAGSLSLVMNWSAVGYLHDVSWSTDSQTALIAGSVGWSDPEPVIIYDEIAGFRYLISPVYGDFFSVSWKPGTNFALIAGHGILEFDGSSLTHIWDPGLEVGDIEWQRGGGYALCVARGIGTIGDFVHKYTYNSGQVSQVFHGSEGGGLYSLSWNPSGIYALAVGERGTMYQLQSSSVQIIENGMEFGGGYFGEDDNFWVSYLTWRGVDFDPTGTQALIVGGLHGYYNAGGSTSRGTILRYDGNQFKRVYYTPVDSVFEDVSWSHDGLEAMIVGGYGDYFQGFYEGRVYSYDSSGVNQMYLEEGSVYRTVQWSPTERKALIGGDFGELLLYEGSSFNHVLTGLGNSFDFTSTAWKSDGSAALLTGTRGILLLFENGSTSVIGDFGSDVVFSDVVWTNNNEHALIVGYNDTSNEGLVFLWNETGLTDVSLVGMTALSQVEWLSGLGYALISGCDGLYKYDGSLSIYFEGGLDHMIDNEGHVLSWNRAREYGLIVTWNHAQIIKHAPRGFTTQKQPNLFVSDNSLSLTPSRPIQDQNTEVQITVWNNGKATANMYRAEVLIESSPGSSSVVKTFLLNELGEGGIEILQTAIPLDPGVSICIVVDSADFVPETSEDDNKACKYVPFIFDPQLDGFSFPNRFPPFEYAREQTVTLDEVIQAIGQNPEVTMNPALYWFLYLFIKSTHDKGHCYGMVKVAMDIYDGKLFLPQGRESSFELTLQDIYDEIEVGQNQVFFDLRVFAKAILLSYGLLSNRQEFDTIQRELLSGRPAVVGMGGSVNHAVIAYRVEQQGNLAKMWVYDPNFPGDMNRTVNVDISGDEFIVGYDNGYDFDRIASLSDGTETVLNQLNGLMQDFLLFVMRSSVVMKIEQPEAPLLEEPTLLGAFVSGNAILLKSKDMFGIGILSPHDGTYRIELKGTDNGEYHLNIIRVQVDSESAIYENDTIANEEKRAYILSLMGDEIALSVKPESNNGEGFAIVLVLLAVVVTALILYAIIRKRKKEKPKERTDIDIAEKSEE